MIKEIEKNIFHLKFKRFGSYVYLLKLDKNILVDTSSTLNQRQLVKDLKKIKLTPNDIDIIILTHNHFDHTGNLSIFKKAKIYASKQDFKSEKIININKLKIKSLKIIKTPGHTKGGICVLYRKILFSGDTLFHRGTIGRTDLRTSDPKEMSKSLEKLKKLNYKLLCPSHGYPD